MLLNAMHARIYSAEAVLLLAHSRDDGHMPQVWRYVVFRDLAINKL